MIENTSGIDYKYKIDPTGSDQTGNMVSNTTETDLVLGELTMTKSVDKAYATIGDILTYTINVSNTGNILATNINFTDTVATGATFVAGSVTVGGTSQPTYNPNTGFSLGSLIILGSTTVTFQVEVTSLEVPNIISNQANTTFNYLVVLPVTGSSSSNTVSTTVNVSILTLVKTASAPAVTTGDTLTYTTVITNTGNIDATEVEFTDTVPAELTFTTGSVVVDSVSEPTYNPTTGFSLGTIGPGSSITVSFDTVVN